MGRVGEAPVRKLSLVNSRVGSEDGNEIHRLIKTELTSDLVLHNQMNTVTHHLFPGTFKFTADFTCRTGWGSCEDRIQLLSMFSRQLHHAP